MPYFLFLGYKHLWFLCYLMLLSRGNFRPVMFKTSNQIVRESHLTHKPTIWTRRILQGESDFVPTNGSFKNHQGTSKISRTFVFFGCVYRCKHWRFPPTSQTQLWTSTVSSCGCCFLPRWSGSARIIAAAGFGSGNPRIKRIKQFGNSEGRWCNLYPSWN